MAGNIKGITIEIGGNTVGLQKALQEVNGKSRDLQGELRQVDRLLKFNPGNSELIAQKQQLLAEQVQNTTQKLSQLKSAQEQVDQQFQNGKINSEQYRAFQREIAATEGSLKNLKTQLENVDGSQQKLEARSKSLQEGLGKVSEGLNGIGTAGAAGAAGVVGLVTGMQETNEQLGMLETQAAAVGVAFDDLDAARGNFAAVGQDVNQATEAMGNLMQAGYKTKDSISEISEAISGAIVKYGETFNAEGLAESITTTTQLGEVTGQFMDLLEKEGINVDDFNKKLQSMSSAEERANFISQTLADQGLNSMFQKYVEMNPEVVKNAEAQQKFQDALSELSGLLAPLVTKITEFVTKVVEWANENPKLAQSIAAIALGIGGLVTVFAVLAPIFTAISGLAGALGLSIGAIVAPIGIAIAAIAAIIAIGVLLYKNWDEIKAKAEELKENVGTKFEEMKTAVSDKIENAKTAAIEKFQNLKTDATNKVSELVTSAKTKFDELKTGISTKIEEAKTAAVNKFIEMKTDSTNKAGELVTSVKTKIGELKQGISDKIADAKTAASTKFGEIKTNLSTQAGEILTTISTKFGEMKSKMTQPFTDAWTSIKEIPGKIKGAFENLSIKIPKPKLPDIDVSWKTYGGGLLPEVKIPNFSINWHKVGGVFTKPVVMGNAGFGDVEEAIVPFEGPHAARIAGLIAKEMLKMNQNTSGGRPIYLTLDVDGETLGSKLVDPIAEEIVLRVGRW